MLIIYLENNISSPKIGKTYREICVSKSDRECLYDDHLRCLNTQNDPGTQICLCKDEELHYWDLVAHACIPRKFLDLTSPK